ncbi:hypothetical protein F1D05_14360 [Kribbella qitaiheensis]|uniref:Uncharacterized protein n=1 Tax=Kribbella qitaiheensis TaxID=1544730 RepID=A0A7G6WY09_9ACTN|nr:hypothetical protein [Kribbella qitaiheensis]QNE18874.1 hypothetical protein F1D05_14360 [Kribbella qitaiheensis]
MLRERRRVRVWFGDTAISDYVAAPDIAARYEEAMRRRFAGLRVTNDELPPLPDPATLQPLK